MNSKKIEALIQQGAELVINFSGGKDSCAMLAYLCEQYPNTPKHVVFADTGWEHTDAEEWGGKIVAMYGLPLHVCRSSTKTFLSMVEGRGMFPGMNQRQCTSDLKRDPINKWIRNNVKSRLIINCTGIRSEESRERAQKRAVKKNKRESNSRREIWDWMPIKAWKEKKVLDYLLQKGIPLHPVYKYLRRFSCRVCIFMTQHDLRQVAIHDPEAIEMIDTVEQKIGFTMFMKGPIKSLAAA